ncbi:hypothetical protein IW138_001997 [Coemansia sp. RSA 986]|nr:hypothetical protein LPJ74_000700 [Coemansia sp. RSA 1843]KAJ2091298.1 hypothetical protein IW138_001997 [Coemansia sp. RSA 986]
MPGTIETAVAAWTKSGNSPYENIEQAKQAAMKLRGFGLCGLCILRYIQLPIGIAYYDCTPEDVYQALGTETDKIRKDAGENNVESHSSQPCTACLGVLDLTLTAPIAEKYGAEAFDSQDVLVGIELPKSIYLRHRSVQVAGKQQGIPSVASGVLEIKDVVRYLILHQLSNACNVRADTSSGMKIEVAFSHSESAPEHELLVADQNQSAKQSKGRRDKKGGTAKPESVPLTVLLTELDRCSDDSFAQRFTCPPPAISSAAKVESLAFKRTSLFVGGRYLKLERNISQTPFIVEGRRVTETSVAEIIGEPLQQLVRCDEYNLVGSGREDADVRMLGDGRPFYIECINPRITTITPEQIHEIEAKLTNSNSSVQVRRLQLIRPEDTSIIKEGEENKTKHYCALVWVSEQLSQEKIDDINSLGQSEILLQQKTPIRVLHRRAPLIRPKKLLSLEISHIEGRFYKVRIESEAGTYIKEFVHGDLGRTTPSLAEFTGHTADILELDVENVSLDFPPAPKMSTADNLE